MAAPGRVIVQHVREVTSAAVQRTVGRYELVEELGRGATSVVYLARQVDLDRPVAMKELAGFGAAGQAATERFLQESRLAGSLTHPNIVTVYEYFEDGGIPFIAMEYLERGSLRQLVGHLGVSQVGGVLEGLLAGLSYAHTHGIVHRDLKPENVLVTSTGTVKIADFGIAKALGSDRALTLSGTTVGTPAYMAPEQAMAGKIGPPADLYATGVIAYELLSGDVPFHGSEVAMAVMLQHLNEPVPPLRERLPDLDSALCAWVERLLAKEPEDRPRDAADAWDELDEILIRVAGPRWRRSSRLGEHVASSGPDPLQATGGTRPAATLQSPTRRLPAAKSRRTAAFAAVGLVLVALGIVAALGLTRRGDEAAATRPSTTSTRADTPGGHSTTAHPVLDAVRLRTNVDGATATLRIAGQVLRSGAVVVQDRTIGDGHAWLELRQKGISTRVERAARGPLAVRIRTGTNLVRIDLAAAPGAFETIGVRRPDRRTVVVAVSGPTTVETSPPPQQPSGTSSTTSTSTTSTPTETTTTTTTPTKKKNDQPPPVKTG